MQSLTGYRRIDMTILRVVVPVAVLLLAALLGYRTSPYWLVLLGAGLGALALLWRPGLGLPAMILAALLVPVQINTGTAVMLNTVSLLVPALLGVWILDMMRQRNIHLAASRTTLPLMLFLIASLFSLVIGIALWNPTVPRSGNFTLVQSAQWALFAFSASAFWLTGNLVRDEIWLRRLTFLFLGLAGILIFLLIPPQISFLEPFWPKTVRLANSITTDALHRAPFWMMITALAGGQLIFNRDLSFRQRILLVAILAGVMIYVFDIMRETVSNWIGVVAAGGTLLWLRFPRLRWLVIALFLMLAATGVLSTVAYEFAGGDAEWERSGGSRLALMSRVVEVTMENPITGLGPAAYRPYAEMKPLTYLGAFWVDPSISSHNNYVDIFSHAGVVGLVLFFWFAAQVARLGLHLRTHFCRGFAAGYVNGMLAAGAAALTLMLFVDWILPFVYNVGFPGFQASILVWLFMGGLVALEQIANKESSG